MDWLCSKRSLSLAGVCLQSTVLAITIHVSQKSSAGRASYKASSAVLLTEIGKIVLSSCLLLLEIRSNGLVDATPEESSEPMSPRSADKSEFDGEDTASLLPQSYRQNHESQLLAYFRAFRAQVLCPNWAYMAFPALLFLVQNNLIYVAARNLSVPVFQITFQIKTLVTALCAVVMLHRKLDKIQWLSLFFLGVGVAVIQLSAGSESTVDIQQSSRWVKPTRDHMIGLAAVTCSCLCSAIAATYFELVLKRNSPPAQVPESAWRSSTDSASNERRQSWPNSIDTLVTQSRHRPSPSLSSIKTFSSTASSTAELLPKPATRPQVGVWARNVQLSFFSVIVGVFVCAADIRSSASSVISTPDLDPAVVTFLTPVHEIWGSFFDEFTVLTWVVIFIQAVGGLLTALVIKHADNVAKGFALSASVVLTVLLSIVFFSYKLTPAVILGSLTVMFTTYAFECHTQIARSCSHVFSSFRSPPPSLPRVIDVEKEGSMH